MMERVAALLRRTARRAAPEATPRERFGDIEIDVRTRDVYRQGVDAALTPMEFDLLLALVRRDGAIATRLELLREVWGHSAAVLTRTVDTHVAELRRKLETDPAEPRHILTVRKAGYRFSR
jgi:two-component system alkaline phosphatase synthesis response regulator PhoP